MTLDHLGIAAADGDAATRLFAALLGAAPYKTETVAREGVTTVFFGDGGRTGAAPKLELLLAESEDSPVGRFLASRGPGLHHIAFEVPDLEAAMARVRALGLRLLADAPKPGADGMDIVFLHPKDTAGVLVELCQRRAPAWETRVVDAPGGALAVHLCGAEDAPALVALHGATAAAAQLRPLTERWARRFRVVALDLPGHGQSAPRGDGAWPTFAEAIAQSLDALGIARAHAFGYSMGGGAALAFALAHPDRVNRLAVHATHVWWDEALVRQFNAGLDARAQPPAYAAHLEAWHGPAWPAVLERTAAFVRALPSEPIPPDALARLRAPTLVTHGDADRLFPVERGVALFRALPEARLVVLPRLGHALASAPEQLGPLAAHVEAHLAPGGALPAETDAAPARSSAADALTA